MEQTQPIRIACWAPSKLEIVGFLQTEKEAMEGAVLGANWIKVSQGRLESSPAYLPLPTPVEDPIVHAYWAKGGRQLTLNFEHLPEHSSPSILIHSLCGYNYTKENYRIQAQRLESYGFDCCRSKRGKVGSIAELWYLCGLILAQGELKVLIDKLESTKQLQAAINFLCSHVSFGALDVCTQRAAMVME